MEPSIKRALSMIDGAWSVYQCLPLPPPSTSRLITRGSVPLDHLSFFRSHYRIPREVEVKVSYKNLPNPGHVVVSSRKLFEISINTSYRGWHDAEVAVMAHEMAHVAMKVHGFKSDDRYMEEVYTDSFAVFLGACLLSNFSESVEFYETQSLSMRLGYLEPQERAYAVAVFLSAARISPPDHPSGPWRRADMVGLERAFSEVASRNAASKSPPRPPDMQCPRCATPVRSSGSALHCGLCMASWRRGFWGWKTTLPPPEVLKDVGLDPGPSPTPSLPSP